MSNFYTDTLQRDSRFHSTAALHDLALLEPGFRGKIASLMDGAAKQGIPLAVTETYRSCERQQQLYDDGKTQLRTVGVHHYGLAVDFAKKTSGGLSWDGDWTFMVDLAKAAGVISGVDWGLPNVSHSFIDSDHIQGCTVAQQSGLFAGTWYPSSAQGVGTVAPVPAVATPIVAPPIPAGLTQAQAQILALIDQVNADKFAHWFWRSTVMAFVETESTFDANAFRQEPSGVASYGLMQVLDITAAGLGLVGDPEQMYDPATSLFYGMKYATSGWNYLQTHLGRPPTIDEWVAGYNEGYGAAANGRPDPEYVVTWHENQAKWASLDRPDLHAC